MLRTIVVFIVLQGDSYSSQCDSLPLKPAHALELENLVGVITESLILDDW